MAMASSDSSGGSGDRDVFGSLPNARPQRRSARRDRPAAKAKPAATGAAEPAAKPKPAAREKAATSAKPKPAARPKTTPPRATAAQIPPAGYATPRTDDDGIPRGADLVTTAVQAAGELAQIGLAAGGRALKSALERLPRP
jgi:hypothetical protein